MPGNKVSIGVNVDDKASRPINDIRGAFKRLQSDGAIGVGLGIGATAAVAGFALVQSAISGVTSALKGAVDAALEDEKSVAMLGSSLEQNVAGWDGNTAAIERTIESRQRLGFTDEQQRDALARLVGATGDATEAQDMLRVAMDLSAFTHKSLEESVSSLTKFEAGRFRGLAELGIETEKGMTKQQALAAVMAQVNGAAETAANTNSGKLLASQIKVNEAFEKLGYEIMPAYVEVATKAADTTSDLALGMKALKEPLGTLVDLFGNFSPGVGIAADATKKLKEEQARLAMETRVGTESARLYMRQLEGGVAVTETFAQKQARLAEAEKVTAFWATIATTNFGQFSDAAQKTGAGLDNVTGRALMTARGFNIMGAEAIGAANAMLLAAGIQAKLSTLHRDAAGDIIRDNPSAVTAADIANQARYTAGFSDRVRIQNDWNAAALRGKAAAGGLASTVKTDLSSAFDRAKDTATKAFDSIHAKNLRAIQDALDHAKAIHKAALAQIDLNLQTAKAKNAAPVTAAEEAQALLEATHRRRDLVEALAAAQAGSVDAEGNVTVDMTAVRNAQEALADFDAQANIDKLKATQAAADAAAEAAAGVETDKANATLTAAENAAAAAKTAEDARFKAQKEGYDKELKNLKTHLENVHAAHKRVMAEIEAAYQKWLGGGDKKSGTGVKTKSASFGAREAGDEEGSDTTGGSTVNMTVNVIAQAGIVDPNGDIAQQVADSLVTGIEKALAQRGIGASTFFGGRA